MWSKISSCAVVLVAFSLLGRAIAQQAPTEVQELRRTMELLEAHLRQLEQGQGKSAANDRVTQIGATREGRNPEMIVRIYDLSDLFALAPTYQAMQLTDLGGTSAPLFPAGSVKQLSSSGMGGGMMGGMGGGMFNVPSTVKMPQGAAGVLAQFGGLSSNTPTGRTTMGELISAIEQTIAPDRWETNGGPSSIAEVGSTLLISADRSMHEQIEALLNLFRQRWRSLRTITVRADWLWLTAAELETLLAAHAAADAGPASHPVIVVDDAAWGRLLSPADQDAQKRRAYNAALTCYNGQTVHTESGGQSLVVTDMTPFVQGGENGKGPQTVLYRPTVTMVQEGAALQITPLATKSARHVVLDVHSRVAHLQKGERARRPNDAGSQNQVTPEEIVDALDRPRLTTHRLSTTLRMPVDRTVLIGGMTFRSEPAAGEPNLYLFARANIQELRDDPQPIEVPAAVAPAAPGGKY